jgi:multisubunit Na+/H+ antiporter MnhE subunit
MVEDNSTTTDPSVCDVRIADLISGCIFAAASLYATSECADGRALICAEGVYVFLLIFFFMMMVCQPILARRAAHGRASGRNIDPMD